MKRNRTKIGHKPIGPPESYDTDKCNPYTGHKFDKTTRKCLCGEMSLDHPEPKIRDFAHLTRAYNEEIKMTKAQLNRYTAFQIQEIVSEEGQPQMLVTRAVVFHEDPNIAKSNADAEIFFWRKTNPMKVFQIVPVVVE